MSWGTPIGSDAHKEEVTPPKGTGDVKVWQVEFERFVREEMRRAFSRQPLKAAEPKPIITRTKRQFDFSK